MYLNIIPTLLLAFVLQTSQVTFEQLIGTWQLVHFDAMDNLRKSPQYLNANPEMRVGLEYKIQNRLDNTVYQFVVGDSLKYTDYVRSEVIQKLAVVEISSDNVLTITSASDIRKAKITEFEESRLVLEPISENPNSGKLVFERIN